MNEALFNTVLFIGVLVGTLLLGRPLIAILRRGELRQHAYEDAPQSHAVKSGTPTMGGLLFIAAVVVAVALRHDALSIALGVLAVLCGAVGFLDDFLAVRGGSNRGLRARTKFLGTGVAAAVFLFIVSSSGATHGTDLLLAFGSLQLGAPHWLWVVLSLCAVIATTHAVNLTDGLDGLAAGTILPPLLVFAWLAFRAGAASITSLDLATCAACLGFLAYNRHPAKLFMGDTGSLALGAVLAGSAILSGNVLLLPLVGGVFAAEAISVILQVTYYKRTHKRIFRMSPLHHHFELSGWPETRVTRRFWTASALLSLAGAALAH